MNALELCQKQRNEIREERDAAIATISMLLSTLYGVEEVLLDVPQSAPIRLAGMKVRAAIAKATIA